MLLALAALFVGVIGWLLCQPPRFVAASQFTVLGFTNLPVVEVFAHELLPKYPSVVRVRVRHHVMWYATGRNLMGRQESGFALEVSAVGRSPEAALQEAYQRMLDFREECRAFMDVQHGMAAPGDVNEVRPYSAWRDSVLQRLGSIIRHHCRSACVWDLWFRINHELERQDNDRSAKRAAEAEAEAEARRPAPVPGRIYE